MNFGFFFADPATTDIYTLSLHDALPIWFFGAHTYRRTVFYGDWTGQEIIRVLMEQVNQRKMRMLDNVYIMKLLKSDNDDGGEVNGALGADIENKEFVTFE
nr:FAD-binding protein [Staphylococcus haemolyticus]